MTVLEFLLSIKPYDFLAWTVIISAIVIFWTWHFNRKNKFDISDLVCENGKLSSSKFMRTGSWAVMSYGFYLLAKTSPESLVGYAPLYGGIWVTARALDKFQQVNNLSLTASDVKSDSTTHAYSESTESKTLTNITLTDDQKDQLKQGFYSEK